MAGELVTATLVWPDIKKCRFCVKNNKTRTLECQYIGPRKLNHKISWLPNYCTLDLKFVQFYWKYLRLASLKYLKYKRFPIIWYNHQEAYHHLKSFSNYCFILSEPFQLNYFHAKNIYVLPCSIIYYDNLSYTRQYFISMSVNLSVYLS